MPRVPPAGRWAKQGRSHHQLVSASLREESQPWGISKLLFEDRPVPPHSHKPQIRFLCSWPKWPRVTIKFSNTKIERKEVYSVFNDEHGMERTVRQKTKLKLKTMRDRVRRRREISLISDVWHFPFNWSKLSCVHWRRVPYSSSFCSYLYSETF